MGEQIVLLVEVKRTDKAFERPPVNIRKSNINVFIFVWLADLSLWKVCMCANSRVLCENVSGHSGHWLASNWSPCLPALCSSYCHFMSKTSWHSSHGKHLQGICVENTYHVTFRFELRTYFCMWNFWCLFSWLREANVLLQMGQRNCIPLVGCEGGSSGRTLLLGLFRFDFNFWRRFLRDMFRFFNPPFPVCNWSWDSEATAPSLWGSSRPPRAIWRKFHKRRYQKKRILSNQNLTNIFMRMKTHFGKVPSS